MRRAGERIDFEVELFGLGQELRVLHRGVEGREQRSGAVGWQAGRRRERTRGLLAGEESLRI